MRNIILRGIALYIDAIFIAFGTILLFILNHLIIGDLNTQMENFTSFNLFKYYFVSYFSYFITLEFFLNTTIGKKIFGYRIEYFKKGKSRKILSVLLRSFFRLIPFNQISFLFNKNKLFWHELISDTRTVKNSNKE